MPAYKIGQMSIEKQILYKLHMKRILILLLLLSMGSTAYSQEFCEYAVPICSNDSFTEGPPFENPGEDIHTPCVESFAANNTYWYYVRILQGSTFTFTASSPSSIDYDIAVWKNPADCNNLSLADRASFAVARLNAETGTYDTGLNMTSTDECEEAGGDAFVKYLDVVPGDIVLIAIDRFSSTTVGFTLSFGSPGGGGGDAVLDCSIVNEGNTYGLCDSGDGTATFDLDEIAEDLTIDDPSLAVTFYTTLEDANEGTQDNIVDSPFTLPISYSPFQLFARITNPDGSLNNVTVITLVVEEVPQANPVLEVSCPEGNIYDLTLYTDEIIGAQTDLVLTYHTTVEDAENGQNPIEDPENYTILESPTVIYVRVDTGNGCYVVTTITFSAEVIGATLDESYVICGTEVLIELEGDLSGFSSITFTWYLNDILIEEANESSYLATESGTYRVEITADEACDLVLTTEVMIDTTPEVENTEDFFCEITGINLTSYNTAVAGEDSSEYTITYYLSEEDALEGVGTIENPENFPLNEDTVIHVRVESEYGCYAIATITLLVKVLDVALGDIYPLCDEEILLEVQGNFDEFTGVIFTWYLNDTIIIGADGPSYPATISGTYTVEITTNEGCTRTLTTEVVADAVPTAFDANDFYCEAGNYDLTSYIGQITGGQSYIVSFFTSEEEAAANENAIENPAGYYIDENTIFYVRVSSQGGCFTVAVLTINIGILEVALGDPFSICEGEVEVTAQGDFSGFTGVTFTWYINNTVIEGANTITYTITAPGTYTVVVETGEGCVTAASIVVTDGIAPVITGIEISPDSVIITAVSESAPLNYSMTGIVWQDSNTFYDLQPGIYTVYVRNADGCIVSETFAIFSIPTMFTPNGDGINDTWRIQGLEIYPESRIQIYDRYGRLLLDNKLTSNVIWDGYSHGNKVPSDDYWYVLNVTDGRKYSGHITVKSRGAKE